MMMMMMMTMMMLTILLFLLQTLLLRTAYDDVLYDAMMTILLIQSCQIHVHPADNRRTRILIHEFHVNSKTGSG